MFQRSFVAVCKPENYQSANIRPRRTMETSIDQTSHRGDSPFLFLVFFGRTQLGFSSIRRYTMSHTRCRRTGIMLKYDTRDLNAASASARIRVNVYPFTYDRKTPTTTARLINPVVHAYAKLFSNESSVLSVLFRGYGLRNHFIDPLSPYQCSMWRIGWHLIWIDDWNWDWDSVNWKTQVKYIVCLDFKARFIPFGFRNIFFFFYFCKLYCCVTLIYSRNRYAWE